jgi:TP53 regulating kinase and related kinases
MQKIAQGAEAIIYKENAQIIKERFSKSYRLAHLDESLRKFRTRREAKILGKLEELNFPAPGFSNFCDQRMSITMDFVPGEKLKDVLIQGDVYQELAQEMGRKIGKLHMHGIVHGDLTTSNMIKHASTGEITLIDFGLSSFSDKVEDKAVDLFLMDRALQSTHYDLYPNLFTEVLSGYKKSNPQAAAVMSRLEIVKSRGRNKK